MIRKHIFALSIITVLLYCVVSVFRIITGGMPDFSVYFYATRDLYRQVNPYTDHSLYTGFGYPPYTALAYLPYLLFSYQGAMVAFMFCSLGSWIGSVFISLRLLKVHHLFTTAAVWIALTFLYFPTKFTLGMGQSNFIVLFLFVSSIYLLERKKEALGGVVFALSLCLKPQMIFILPFLFALGKMRYVMFILGSTAVLFFASVLYFGLEVQVHYLTDMALPLLVFRNREIYYNQGFAAVFSRLLPLHIATIATAISTGIVYAAGLVLARRQPHPLTILMIVPSILLLIEPLSWQHHYVFLIPTYIFFWYTMHPSPIKQFLFFISYILVGYNIQVPESVLSGVLNRIAVSHVFLGNCIIFIISQHSLWKKSYKAPSY